MSLTKPQRKALSELAEHSRICVSVRDLVNRPTYDALVTLGYATSHLSSIGEVSEVSHYAITDSGLAELSQ